MNHLSKYWSAYLVVVAAVAPYAPLIHTVTVTILSQHPKLVADIAAVLVFVAHQLPPGTNLFGNKKESTNAS